MGMYSRKEFLEYYKFKDEPESVPQIFHHHQNSYTNLVKQVKEDVAVGVKLIDAIRLNAGVTTQLAYKWQRDFIKEVDDGKTDTPLIRLFTTGLKSDAKLYRKVMTMTMKKAEEGDASTIQYLAKHRLGYNSQNKQEIELSSKDEAPIKFVFTDMTPVDKEEEDDD